MSVSCTPVPPPLRSKSGKRGAIGGDGTSRGAARRPSGARGGAGSIGSSTERQDVERRVAAAARPPAEDPAGHPLLPPPPAVAAAEASPAAPPEAAPPAGEAGGGTGDGAERWDRGDGAQWPERPSTPIIIGHEVMEERARFTIYKVLVRGNTGESWVVFRRYTDFSRLNDKLREMFPGFRLALPPKRWFKDNFDVDFLEERTLGLAAFLQNLVAHQDVANCVPVREFLCLDDSPGPFDSLEESRAFCESLEETNFRLLKELSEEHLETAGLRAQLLMSNAKIEALETEIRQLKMGSVPSHGTVEFPPPAFNDPQ